MSVVEKKMQEINAAYKEAMSFFKYSSSNSQTQPDWLRRKAEEEAKRKAEEEARRKAEEEARRKAEEEARRKAEEEARRDTILFTLQLFYPNISLEDAKNFEDIIYNTLINTYPVGNLSKKEIIKLCFNIRYPYFEEDDAKSFIDIILKLYFISKTDYENLFRTYRQSTNNTQIPYKMTNLCRNKYIELSNNSNLELLKFLEYSNWVLVNKSRNSSSSAYSDTDELIKTLLNKVSYLELKNINKGRDTDRDINNNIHIKNK